MPRTSRDNLAYSKGVARVPLVSSAALAAIPVLGQTLLGLKANAGATEPGIAFVATNGRNPRFDAIGDHGVTRTTKPRLVCFFVFSIAMSGADKSSDAAHGICVVIASTTR